MKIQLALHEGEMRDIIHAYTTNVWYLHKADPSYELLVFFNTLLKRRGLDVEDLRPSGDKTVHPDFSALD